MNLAPLHTFLRMERDRAATTFVLDEELGTHHGLSWADFVLLHTLDDDGREMPQRQLAKRLGLHGSKLLMQIRPLEKLGLLSRNTDAREPVGGTACSGLGRAGERAGGSKAAGRHPLAASDWTEGARRAGRVALFVRINFALGWLAIAAVLLWR
jgi:hypothetical protein